MEVMGEVVVVVPQVAYGWEMWLLCGSVPIALFSLLFLIAHYFSDDPFLWDDSESWDDHEYGEHGRYGEYGKYGKYAKLGMPCRAREGAEGEQGKALLGGGWGSALPFPEKENKLARFKRWATCFRRKTPAARPPIEACHVEVSIQVAIEPFVSGMPRVREHTHRRSKEIPFPSVPATPADVAWADSKKGYAEGAQVECKAADQKELEEGEGERERERERKYREVLSGRLNEEIRQRILEFLIKAGPPKSLCTIKEEEAGEEVEEEEEEEEAAVTLEGMSMTSLSVSASEPTTLNGPFEGAMRKGARKGAVVLDGEEVLRVRSKEQPLTRETLWAVLAAVSMPPYGEGKDLLPM